jgi:hypothetical protein
MQPTPALVCCRMLFVLAGRIALTSVLKAKNGTRSKISCAHPCRDVRRERVCNVRSICRACVCVCVESAICSQGSADWRSRCQQARQGATRECARSTGCTHLTRLTRQRHGALRCSERVRAVSQLLKSSVSSCRCKNVARAAVAQVIQWWVGLAISPCVS